MAPLGLLLFLAFCSGKKTLSGPELEAAIRLYLNEQKAFADFTGEPNEVERLITKVLAEHGPVRAGQDTAYITGLDGKQRALGLHIPALYAPERLAPVVLWLHGGGNGTRQDKGADAAHFFAREADSLYFIFAAVSGERGATWFDETGMANIQKALRYIKQTYAVDDNRVVLAGVSDGGTGCFVSGMHYPGSFAGYVVVSGAPALLPMLHIASVPFNMKLRPWYVIHGGLDRLYPGVQARQAAALFTSLGVDYTFHYYPEWPHGLDSISGEKAGMLGFALRVRRDPCPDEIAFKTFEPMRVSWLSIDSLAPPAPGALVQPASVRARKQGRRLVIDAERVSHVSLYAAQPLFTPGEKAALCVNGHELGERVFTPEGATPLDYAREMRDRAFLPFCRIAITVTK